MRSKPRASLKMDEIDGLNRLPCRRPTTPRARRARTSGRPARAWSTRKEDVEAKGRERHANPGRSRDYVGERPRSRNHARCRSVSGPARRKDAQHGGIDPRRPRRRAYPRADAGRAGRPARQRSPWIAPRRGSSPSVSSSPEVRLADIPARLSSLRCGVRP
jgi:hypothetical protein